MDECSGLGLFHTRAPQFSQLFFHDFSEEEICGKMGQTFQTSTSYRAAQSYLKSGYRLESKCGISDVWFCYVEDHQDLFRMETEPISSPSRLTPISLGPHPRIDPAIVPIISDTFPWLQEHEGFDPIGTEPISRPDGTQSSAESIFAGEDTPSGEDGDEISEFTDLRPHSPMEDGIHGVTDGTTGIDQGEGRSQSITADDGGLGQAEDANGLGQEVDEFDFGDDDIPITSSFQRELAGALDQGILLEAHLLVNTVVPSSIPGEQFMQRPPVGVGTVDIIRAGVSAEVAQQEEIRRVVPMEGIELSQPVANQGSVGDDDTGDEEMDEGMRITK